MQTYIYEIEKNGDPNSEFDPNDPEQVETQYLVKWKGWAHLHNTWESDESLRTQKVQNYPCVCVCLAFFFCIFSHSQVMYLHAEGFIVWMFQNKCIFYD